MLDLEKRKKEVLTKNLNKMEFAVDKIDISKRNYNNLILCFLGCQGL